MEQVAAKDSFSIFRKTYALLVNPGKESVFMSFRMNPDPKSGKHFPKETQTTFNLDEAEILEFVKVMDGLLKGKDAKREWIHDPAAGTEEAGSEIKTLTLALADHGIMIRLHLKTRDNQQTYTLILNKFEAMHLNLKIKLWFYEMQIGTKTGFTYNWI